MISMMTIFAYGQELVQNNGLYYKRGALYTGTHVEKHDNGNTKLEINIVNGQPHGEMKLYYESGEIKEQRYYHKGKKDSLWITWDTEGNKTAEARYDNGKKDGLWYIWDKNGTLRYEMFYKDGEKTGTWKMWNEKGELISTKEF